TEPVQVPVTEEAPAAAVSLAPTEPVQVPVTEEAPAAAVSLAPTEPVQVPVTEEAPAAAVSPAPMEPAAQVPTEGMETSPPPVAAASEPARTVEEPAASVEYPNQGQVVASMDASTYSYVQVENNGRQFWLAGNHATVQVGETIHWNRFSVMKNFFSRTLNRTFDEILFVDAILPGAAPPPPVAFQAKVVERLPTSSYVYLQVEGGAWLAAPMNTVQVGQTITWTGGAVMRDFDSKELQRTFPEVLFVGSVTVIP
ncbi:MAG: hypothetical protein HQL59_12660, partial [Magnetococcales bacterium]|nr:hypothetical protein [Magnetococcales bacterium]